MATGPDDVPFTGEDRKSSKESQTDAIDPNRTS